MDAEFDFVGLLSLSSREYFTSSDAIAVFSRKFSVVKELLSQSCADGKRFGT